VASARQFNLRSGKSPNSKWFAVAIK
jgi:hypothetical protein